MTGVEIAAVATLLTAVSAFIGVLIGRRQNGKPDHGPLEAMEIRTMLTGIKDAVAEGNKEHVVALQAAVAALNGIARHLQAHETAASPAIAASLETNTIVKHIERVVTRKRGAR